MSVLGWPNRMTRAMVWMLPWTLALLVTQGSCATISGGIRPSSPADTALKVALKVALVAAENLPKLIELISGSVAKQRQREKHLKAVAAEVFSGECLAAPLLTPEGVKELQTQREQGADVLVGGLKKMTVSQPKSPRELLVAVALLIEKGLSRTILKASLGLAQATMKKMEHEKDKDEQSAKLDTAMVQYLIGTIQTELGQLQEAEQSLNASLKTRQQVQGDKHVCVAQSEQKLGNLFVARGKYQMAESLYLHALAIKKTAQAADPKSTLVADALLDLAEYHNEVAHYESALKDYRDAARILNAQANDKPSAKLADIDHGQGTIFFLQGDHGKAEHFFRSAYEVRQHTLAEAEKGCSKVDAAAELRKDLAVSYDALGNLYLTQGSFKKAKETCEDAVSKAKDAVYRSTPSACDKTANAEPKSEPAGTWEQSKLYAAVLDHCGDVYRKMALEKPKAGEPSELQANLTEADKKYEKALQLRQELFKKDGPNVFLADSMLNRASLRRDDAMHRNGGEKEQKLELAEKEYQRALKIQLKALGEDHPRVAETRTELGRLYQAQGNAKKAEEILLHALKSAQAAKERNPNPFSEARIREELAALYLGTAQPQEALTQLREAFVLNEKFPLSSGLRVDDARLDDYLATLSRQEAMIYSLLLNPQVDRAALPLAFQVALSRKGRSLEELASSALRCADITDKEVRELCDRQKLLLREYSDNLLSSQSAGDAQRQGLMVAVDKARREREEVQAKLGQRRALFAFANARSAPDQIVREVAEKLTTGSALIEVVAFHPYEASTFSISAEQNYVALVLLPGGTMKHVVWSTGVDKKIDEFRAQMELNKLQKVNGVAAAQQAAQALHAQIMKPLAAVLGDSRKLYLSLDQQLNLVPFWALYDPEKGQYLIDSDYRFIYLTTGRDLLKTDLPDTTPPRRVAIFAAPRLSKQGGWGADAKDDFTRKDLQAIKGAFPTAQTFTGTAFKKSNLLNQKGPPAILHVASHGAFVRDLAPSGSPTEGTEKERDLSLAADCQQRFKDPMLNLRIALSGAKRSCTVGDPSANTGYTTAAEMSTMDLRGTQIVVLAACETGLGTSKPGQGLYGMRRALKLAGSETQIVSLWNASNKAAGPLWASYYKRLSTGEDRIEALRAAAQEVKTTVGMEHPYYWSVFIAAGKDGPLQDAKAIASHKEPKAVRVALKGKAKGGLRGARRAKATARRSG